MPLNKNTRNWTSQWILVFLTAICILYTSSSYAMSNIPIERADVNRIQTTASGLKYFVLQEGKGTPPTPSNRVTVHYSGTLQDGTEFDSSYRRGQPATFALNQVIDGWTEGLQLIKPGGKIQLIIPPKLAYGDNQRTNIPAGSTLTFIIELISVQ